MLKKRTSSITRPLTGAKTRRMAAPIASIGTVDRRTFLKGSGMAVAGLAALGTLPATRVRKAPAQEPAQTGAIEERKTICPYCAVGCSIIAEVQNGVWIGQEPAFASPINMGTHCAKGAAAREVALGERRLKYPMKLEDGQWRRLSWSEAIEEVGDRLLAIREREGPEAVYWLGSAKFSNEQAYLMRKFVAFWGTNNVDHQARICHSTTVAGVANTFGYGAMTNSFNDIHNSKAIFLLGGNPAEAHPISMLHLLHAKEQGAHFIVVDPRYTRTAAHATEYVRIRPSTDIAFLWGVLWHILRNGWEDQDYIASRVYGFEEIRAEVENYPPDVVENITGVAADQVERVARIMAENRPGTLVWCMGLTQSTKGHANTRAASIFQLALGNIGVAGGGTNIFRGHDNVQGATDLGLDASTLPAYYGLSQGAWQHWARVWDVDYEWLKSRFTSQELMETTGMPVSRWFDGVLEATENLDQPTQLRGMVFWGHAVNSQTRQPDAKRALEQLDTLLVIDPHPTLAAVLGERRDGVYLLPSGYTMEIAGSVTNSQRALQWRERVVEPIFEAKSDYEITYLLARKFGFAEELFNQITVENDQPLPEDLLREINRGTWTIGYTGQSPERLKRHMEHQDKFDTTTCLGMSAPVEGEYYGLPWPCWGTPELGHPGTPLLYDASKAVSEGGLPFRARWGVEYQGDNLLAEGSAPPESEIEDGYPEITLAMLTKFGWNGEFRPQEALAMVATAAEAYEPGLLDLSDEEAESRLRELLDEQDLRLSPEQRRSTQPGAEGSSLREQAIETYETNRPPIAENPQEEESNETESADQGQQTEEGFGEMEFGGGSDSEEEAPLEENPFTEALLQINWKSDLSGGIQRVAIAHGLAPFGNGKARALAWNFPDPVPIHREPLYTTRRDLLPEYETYEDRRDYRLPILYRTIQQRDFSQDFPLILTSGRLVEHEGGGDSTRSNKWLAEFQPRMFAEINPSDAAAAGIQAGSELWLHTPEGARVRVPALITNRVGRGTVFMPFHFGGWFQGEDFSGRYPAGTVPYVVGEAANTATTYGYDPVTLMQESKATLCRIEPA
ncbi:formate dehydrogenase subunit alpha [Aquibaculum sediminis]|uniref:formate dehydrogenase subunit alpha n=1 Tax=Aquibaculum sediminis TaxID=3231907 RepID=UPI003452FE4A